MCKRNNFQFFSLFAIEMTVLLMLVLPITILMYMKCTFSFKNVHKGGVDMMAVIGSFAVIQGCVWILQLVLFKTSWKTLYCKLLQWILFHFCNFHPFEANIAQNCQNGTKSDLQTLTAIMQSAFHRANLFHELNS